jgi:hypothetical protein
MGRNVAVNEARPREGGGGRGSYGGGGRGAENITRNIFGVPFLLPSYIQVCRRKSVSAIDAVSLGHKRL